jgi:hypothetical protein
MTRLYQPVKVVALFILMFVLYSCSSTIKPELLYGKWIYIKVSNPNSDPPDSVSRSEIADKKPYIEINKDARLTIVWGGAVLSHGTYVIEGNNIQYTEALGGGKTRKFPFWVKRLTASQLVFETTGADGTHVEAQKVSQ